jgi:F0F1-type ATP synthase assembly protein I
MKGLAKNLSAKLANRAKSARAAATRNKEFVADALTPLAAGVGGALAGLIDGSVEDNTVGESPVSKGQLAATAAGMTLGFLLRRSTMGRKLSFGVASGGVAPFAYLQGLQSASAARQRAAQ